MSMTVRLAVASMVGLAAMSIAEPATACSCVPRKGTSCDAFVRGGSIFVGTVKSRTTVTALLTGTTPSGTPTETKISMYEFVLSVEERFKGVDEDEVTVDTAANTAACGFPFEVGKSYLVDASRGANGIFSTGICSGTQSLESAANTVALYRQLQNGNTVSRIYGSITKTALKVDGRYIHHEPAGPLPDIEVAIRGDLGSGLVRTDRDGSFSLEGLPPGKYTVEPRLPAMWRQFRSPAVVETSECAFAGASFSVISDSPLSGVVRGPDGRPVGKDVEIDVIRVEGPNDDPKPISKRSTSTLTKEKGEWTFDGLPAGRYVIGVQLTGPPAINSPFSRAVYPKGTSIDEAEEIEVVEGHKVRIDIRVGAPLAKRFVSGIIVDEAGRPIVDAWVDANDTEFPTYGVFGVATKTDGEGRFSMPALEGRRYLLKALSFQPRGETDDVTIPESGAVAELRLILKPKQ